MSSGAYVIAVPLGLLGGAVMAVGAIGSAAGQALGAAGDAALDQADKLWSIVEQERQRQLALAEQSGYLKVEVMRAHEAAEAVLADIAQFKDSLRTMNFQYNAETMTFAAREEGVSTEAAASVNLADLMFMEVDAQTSRITYVVLDYSEAISLQSAKNSAQFKKLALASDLMKQVMVWVVEDPREQEMLNQLIGVVNEMLDDHSVSFSHFQQFVQMRFAQFRRLQDSVEVDTALWDEYCALCAIRGERPKCLGKEALVQEIRRLMEAAAGDKFVAAARRAFRETVLEMGMEIHSDHMLDRVPGMLLVDKENPGYSMFVSEHDVSFMLEMVETGAASEEDSQKQHDNMCQKRRELEKRMLEKGFRLKLCASEDDTCVTASVVEEKKDDRQSRADLLRRRRALEGKQAKLKMAGGN